MPFPRYLSHTLTCRAPVSEFDASVYISLKALATSLMESIVCSFAFAGTHQSGHGPCWRAERTNSGDTSPGALSSSAAAPPTLLLQRTQLIKYQLFLYIPVNMKTQNECIWFILIPNKGIEIRLAWSSWTSLSSSASLTTRLRRDSPIAAVCCLRWCVLVPLFTIRWHKQSAYARLSVFWTQPFFWTTSFTLSDSPNSWGCSVNNICQILPHFSCHTMSTMCLS